jgi:hypothetical protein
VRPGDDEPYTVDDLVAHEKRQMRFVLVILLAAMAYFIGQRLLGPRRDIDGVPPTTSAAVPR